MSSYLVQSATELMKHQRCEPSALLNTTLLQHNLRPKNKESISYFNQASI